MKHINELFSAVTEKLQGLARKNAVVARPISVGERHVVPLCELSLGFGGGGGLGEGDAAGAEAGDGTTAGVGGAAAGGAKAAPVAVLIIENGKARLDNLGR